MCLYPKTKATTQGIINDMRNVLTNIRNANTNERNMLINQWKQATEKELKTRRHIVTGKQIGRAHV